ncbi:M48 family metallopeptidase [Phreatobacter sp.]|uniref:M48 family metallopeptidase n=1 Tax=Phreatobacter sp. TaxID=1966341 RepID=UPI003F6FD3F4
MSIVRRLFQREPDPQAIEVVHEGVAYPVALRRMPQARRFTLRVRAASRDAVLSMPARARLSDAVAFAHRHGGWIATRLARIPEGLGFHPGVVVPLRGMAHEVVHRPERRGTVWVEDGAIHVAGDADFLARRVQDFLKREARRDLEAATRRHAAAIGVKVTRIGIRDQASRWGSASSTGAINYSWRLILAPPFVLDYLAAHEVAHLREMNHSPRFWRIVRDLCPHMEAAKAWLRANGANLHRYGAG